MHQAFFHASQTALVVVGSLNAYAFQRFRAGAFFERGQQSAAHGRFHNAPHGAYSRALQGTLLMGTRLQVDHVQVHRHTYRDRAHHLGGHGLHGGS